MDYWEVERLAQQSTEAAGMLRALANQQRLLILCHLSTADEMSVSTLHGRLLLSQSALSQHLARLREEGLVAYRREAQTLFYRVADERALRLLSVLHELYCPELAEERES